MDCFGTTTIVFFFIIPFRKTTAKRGGLMLVYCWPSGLIRLDPSHRD